MKEQILRLLKLQEVDAKLVESAKALKEIPGKLEELDEQLGRFEALLAEERSKVEDAAKWLSEQESVLKTEEERIVKTKQQLQQIRNAREYGAMQRQLETFKKTKMDREEEILKLLSALEASRAKLAQHESEFEELRKHIQEEKAALQEELEGARSKQDEMKDERRAATESIERDLLRKYEFIAAHVQPAVVPARSEVCTGCNMNIPPQIYNILYRVDSIESCPNCRRILYLESAVLGDSQDAQRADGDSEQ